MKSKFLKRFFTCLMSLALVLSLAPAMTSHANAEGDDNAPLISNKTYSITLDVGKHGSVTVEPTSAAAGTLVTVTTVADSGFTLEIIKVTDKDGKEPELTNKENRIYSFKMPESDVTVKATFMEDNSIMDTFIDVENGSFYFDAVAWAISKGMTTGTDDTHFSPDDVCTRAQAVTFLWRTAGSPEPKTTKMPFTDVSADSWFYKAVLWATENNITKGTTDTTFSPDLHCSRGMIVTLLHRANGAKTAGTTNPFSDVKSGDWYYDSVLWAVNAHVTTGTSETTFDPYDECTRSQIITFIYRASK